MKHGIEFEEKHRSKLIEMCKEIFPESDPQIYSKDIIGLWIILTNDGVSEGKYLFKFHWFEFCLTQLATNILQWKHDLKQKHGYYHIQTLEVFISDIVFYKKHPIDILYKEYKNILKNEKNRNSWMGC